MPFGGVRKPHVRLDVVNEASVPIVVDDALVEIEYVGHASPSDVGDDDVQAAHDANRLVDQAVHGRLVAGVGLDGVEARRLGMGGGNGRRKGYVV